MFTSTLSHLTRFINPTPTESSHQSRRTASISSALSSSVLDVHVLPTNSHLIARICSLVQTRVLPEAEALGVKTGIDNRVILETQTRVAKLLLDITLLRVWDQNSKIWRMMFSEALTLQTPRMSSDSWTGQYKTLLAGIELGLFWKRHYRSWFVYYIRLCLPILMQYSRLKKDGKHHCRSCCPCSSTFPMTSRRVSFLLFFQYLTT